MQKPVQRQRRWINKHRRLAGQSFTMNRTKRDRRIVEHDPRTPSFRTTRSNSQIEPFFFFFFFLSPSPSSSYHLECFFSPSPPPFGFEHELNASNTRISREIDLRAGEGTILKWRWPDFRGRTSR